MAKNEMNKFPVKAVIALIQVDTDETLINEVTFVVTYCWSETGSSVKVFNMSSMFSIGCWILFKASCGLILVMILASSTIDGMKIIIRENTMA